ncbi:MAG: chemotaxis response regulator protein-glutamate methylesterase [Spirochaetes bacterium]|nr:chemotaxis response regulator protein-glutamate methylesterase [Spirochaetota bacterium]
MKKIRVLIVDDSAVVRKYLTEVLSRARGIEVVATALDPIIAVEKIKKFEPDVLTLDVEMPRMDGLTFLSKLMIARPMPVIMVSSFTDTGARVTMSALELGAVDFILKPAIGTEDAHHDFSRELVEKIIAASQSKVRPGVSSGAGTNASHDALAKHTADVILPPKRAIRARERSEKVIAIGASTGGTEAIAAIIKDIPDDLPGIMIVQHMPEKFTRAFADRINSMARLYVKEAEDGDRLYRGIALVAPGNRHLILRSDMKGYFVEVNDGLPVNRHRPSVDVLFRSVAQTAGRNALGILLTGMGSDGATGLLEMKEADAVTVAQDQASCVVFGMPREAIRIGAVSKIMNIREITALLNEQGREQVPAHRPA